MKQIEILWYRNRYSPIEHDYGDMYLEINRSVNPYLFLDFQGRSQETILSWFDELWFSKENNKKILGHPSYDAVKKFFGFYY